MRVLYVSTTNSYRSPLAEALTRKHHPAIEVESAGIHSKDYIVEAATKQLEEVDALKFVKPKPDQISQRALHEASNVVCMMPKHSEYIKRNFKINPSKIEVWGLNNPLTPKINKVNAFKYIEEKVKDKEY